jgi:acetyltransferase-like isoleucine patch superfamily enzyme
MLKRILLSVYFFLRFKFLNFIIPNLKRVFSKKLIYTSIPSCQQKTIITGEGVVYIGKDCNFGFKYGGFHKKGLIEIQPRYENAVIKIGNNVATNNNIFICAAKNIEIGDNTLIGQNVTLMDFEAHGIHPNKRRVIGEIGSIKIGNNVWIGNNVTILKNSEVGDNTIVATGAVVAGKFPSNIIIGGVPAKIIKAIDC